MNSLFSRSIRNYFLILKERPQVIPFSRGACAMNSLFPRSVRNLFLILQERPR